MAAAAFVESAGSEAERDIVDFLNALVHLVLYCRHVYPAETFERCHLFDVVVYRRDACTKDAVHMLRIVAARLAAGRAIAGCSSTSTRACRAWWNCFGAERRRPSSS